MRTLLFEHGGERYGLEVARIVEVLPAVRWRPLVDSSILLGGGPTALRVGSRVAVAPLAEGGALGGILLESVLGLEEIDFAAGGAFAGAAGPRGPVARHGGGTVQLVRPDRLLDREQLARILGEAA
jgi:chemotaxis signal transduction protein